MTLKSIKSLLAISAMALILAACAVTPDVSAPASPAPSQVGTPVASPSAAPSDAPEESPAESPAASPDLLGTLTVADGAVVDGPGAPLAEVLAGDLSQPVFVRGALFLGADGQVYFADSVTDGAAPEFGDLRLAVANYPTDGPTWDMADADITGLQEANGIRFFEDIKLYGTISH